MFRLIVHYFVGTLYCRLCSSDYVYAYLHNDDAPEVANPETGNNDRTKPAASSIHSHSSALTDVADIDSRHSVTKEQSSEANVPAKRARTVKNVSTSATDKVGKEFCRVEGAVNASSRWTLQSASSNASSSQVSTCSSIETSDSQASSHVQADIGKEDFVLHPDSFRVLLCVDNQEYYAKYVIFHVICKLFTFCLLLDICKNWILFSTMT